MREIKFRAWDKIDKKMWTDIQSLDFFYKSVTFATDKFRDYFQSFENTELMQFTGLHDKNGKEIYEGDVVEWIGSHLQIKYSLLHACFDMCGKRGNEETRDLLTKGLAKEFIVVGNIYENPEYVKEEARA